MNIEQTSNRACRLTARIVFAMRMERRCYRMFQINITLTILLLTGGYMALIAIEAPARALVILLACATSTFTSAYYWHKATLRALDLTIHAADQLQKLGKRTLLAMSESRWKWDESTNREGGGLRHRLHAKECTVDLFRRPPYCDRGSWIAYVLCHGFPVNPSPFDHADAFPRYYFDLERAKAEIEALFDKRGYTPYEAKHENPSTRG